MTINNINEANQALLPYVPLVARVEGQATTLERIIPLMEMLGNPQDTLKVIHVAGTSGKTSTSYYMSALLTATGSKVGLTVSPHIDSVAERVQINGQVLPEAEFCELLGEFIEVVEKAEQAPSYFELLYAFAIWVFAKHEVDYAVVETGMGGLHDATNMVTRMDKICVITDIGFDHMHILGKTLTAITTQKAGIIHEGNPVFMYEQSPEVMNVIYSTVREKRAELHIAEQPNVINPSGIPDYQFRNWQLAQVVYEYVTNKDGLQHLTSQELLQTQAIQVPARMDIRQVNGKTIVMDGAHNHQKMSTFISSFNKAYPDIKPALLVAFKQGKEYEELAPMLAEASDRIIVTTFNTSQDLPVKSEDPAILAGLLQASGAKQVDSIVDQHDAYAQLLSGSEDVLIITGSFYLISQLRGREGLS